MNRSFRAMASWRAALGVLFSAGVAACLASNAAAQVEPRTGSFLLSATATELLGEQAAEGMSRLADPGAAITWEVVVPDNYDPATPPGVLVYISPDDSGKPPAKWRGLIAERNLIWIGANDHGNVFTTARRIGAALLAVARIEKEYQINPERKYVAGFSGGGRVASTIAYVFSKAFRGYVFICGVNRQKDPPPRIADMKENRYVFLTGSGDFNRVETSQAFADYEKLGITSAKLMVVGMDHELPRQKHMGEALNFLDGAEPAD